MAKKRTGKKLVAAAAAVLTALMLTGCAGRHRISVISGEEFLDSCPKTAKTGETVTVYTMFVTDADLDLYAADSTEVVRVREGVYEFVMPDHDVKLRITVTSNGLA